MVTPIALPMLAWSLFATPRIPRSDGIGGSIIALTSPLPFGYHSIFIPLKNLIPLYGPPVASDLVAVS